MKFSVLPTLAQVFYVFKFYYLLQGEGELDFSKNKQHVIKFVAQNYRKLLMK